MKSLSLYGGDFLFIFTITIMRASQLASFLLLMSLTQLFTACKNLKRMLPEGAALHTKERAEILYRRDPHVVKYTAEPLVDFPVLPVQVWAATYELDLILVSKHPAWNMHEYAKLATPEGEVWIMKDAEEGSLNQFIVADISNIQSWLPELPVVRKQYPVKVRDNSTNKMLDLEFEYENIKGTVVKAKYQGKYPKTALKKRNGSTMGHSRNQLLVALDLPYRDFGKKASITYDGQPYKMDKLLGLIPFQMALQQTQGGLSSGRYDLRKEKNGQVVSTHYNQDTPVEQNWTYVKTPQETGIQQLNEFRSLHYKFKGTINQELEVATVHQWDQQEEGTRITFAPPLPDIRRPFEGQYRSDFVIDMNGQQSNATGEVIVEWINGKASIIIQPAAPWWMVDRPMQTLITYTKGKASVEIKMLPDPTKDKK
ncbi:MAG: hypothetical protein ACRBFS_14815 [Aureispira sp.]